MSRSGYELAEALDIKLRNAISEAEETYNNPHIIIVMSEEVMRLIRKACHIPEDAGKFKVNKHPTHVYDGAGMQVVVVGEGFNPRLDR